MSDVWTLVFSDPEPLGTDPSRRVRLLYWFLRRLRPGFRHVFATRPEGDGWLIVNWHSGRLDILLHSDPIVVGDMRFPDYGAFIAAMEQAGHAHTLIRDVHDGKTPRLRGLATCVTAMKHLLGLRAPGVVTPWQLYRHLRRI